TAAALSPETDKSPLLARSTRTAGHNRFSTFSNFSARELDFEIIERPPENEGIARLQSEGEAEQLPNAAGGIAANDKGGGRRCRAFRMPGPEALRRVVSRPYEVYVGNRASVGDTKNNFFRYAGDASRQTEFALNP